MKTHLSIVLALSFSLLSAAPSQAGEKQNVPPEGFVALFNGKDLSGWKGLVGNPKTRAQMSPEELAQAQEQADEQVRKHWNVEDGVLVFDGEGQSLCTDEDYRNFELYVDWKIKEKGDSGIYLRGTPQVQIWDPDAGERNQVGSGGLYNNQENPSEPLVCADNPIGEWNTFFIRMVDDRVTVKLNGKLVVDNVVLENFWERDKPIYETGQIELQNHGNTLYFRNIFLRELPGDADPADYQNGEKISLFDGEDLSKWDFREGGWTIADDGSLARQEGAGYIWSKDRFGDFILDLDFKVSEGCNSGVFFRTDDTNNSVQTGIEIQILDSYGKETVGKHDCGAVYDVKAPRSNAVKAPGEWNRMRIVAQDNLLSVTLNDERIIDMDLNDWTEAGKNPDGTKNKYNTAYKDMKREGHIGFQDHGHPVWYRDVCIKSLD